jgi:outer membrane protein OmpA-like peptidoglycan-associated protein
MHFGFAPLGLLLATPAFAQDGLPTFDVQNVRPTIDAKRTLLTDDAGLAPSNSFVGRFVLSTASDMLTFTPKGSKKTVSLLGSLVTADVIFGYTISRFRMGIDIPVVLSATSDVLDGGGGGLGDLAVDFRGTILDPEDGTIGLALSTRFGAPTATVDLPIGGSGIGYEAAVIVDKRMGDLTAVTNLGYRGRPPAELDNLEVGNQIASRFGLGYQLSKSVGLSGDVVGHLTASDMGNAAGGAWEGLVGGWYRFDERWVVRLGLGAGLSQGIGTSAFRSMLSVGYEPDPVLDTDADGFVDRDDRCPDAAEDIDGYQDTDGCPDELNPVRLLFRDPYGYPVDDLNLNMSNEDDGTEVTGGAKVETTLTPGVWSIEASATGFDDFEDDFTVEEGQAFEGVFVLNPAAPPPQVRVTRKAIRITDKIYFEVNEDTIRSESFAILNAIADTMVAHPEVKRVRVEGHTDSRSSDSYNLELSQRRAEAVRLFLIENGVAADRLVAEGKGERDPLDARENPAAWDLNRRVEFLIESRE